MTGTGVEILAASLARLKEVAATWLHEAAWVSIGVVSGRLEDGWAALRIEIVTFEDQDELPPDFDSVGLDGLRAVRWRVPATDLDAILARLSLGEIDVGGLGAVRFPLPLPGAPQVTTKPEVDRRRPASGWPHHRLEVFGKSLVDEFGEKVLDGWDRDLRLGGIDGVAGLLGLLGADPTDRNARWLALLYVLVPRFVAIAKYGRDGDDLHIQIHAGQPMRHAGAEIMVFAAPEPSAIARIKLRDLRRAHRDGPLRWTVRLPPHTAPRIDLVEDGVLLQSCVVEYQLPPASPQRDDGSWRSDDRERVPRLHRELFVLTQTKPKNRGPRFERAVHEVLDVANLLPFGSFRVGVRPRLQIDNAIIIDGTTVLIEVTTESRATYLRSVRSRLDKLPPDARCVLVILSAPTEAQQDWARELRRVAFATADDLRLYLGGVTSLTDFLRWKLRELARGRIFVPTVEYLDQADDADSGRPQASRGRRAPKRKPRKPGGKKKSR
jgi:hypothetical protein